MQYTVLYIQEKSVDSHEKWQPFYDQLFEYFKSDSNENNNNNQILLIY